MGFFKLCHILETSVFSFGQVSVDLMFNGWLPGWNGTLSIPHRNTWERMGQPFLGFKEFLGGFPTIKLNAHFYVAKVVSVC